MVLLSCLNSKLTTREGNKIITQNIGINKHVFSLCNKKIIIIIYSLEFFISANADGFSVEFEWQQVSSILQDSSQYSGRSQKCSSLDGLHSSANFQVLQSQ